MDGFPTSGAIALLGLLLIAYAAYLLRKYSRRTGE